MLKEDKKVHTLLLLQEKNNSKKVEVEQINVLADLLQKERAYLLYHYKLSFPAPPTTVLMAKKASQSDATTLWFDNNTSILKRM